MLPIQNYMVLNGDIRSSQITCGLTSLKGHVQHRSRHITAHAQPTSRTYIILFQFNPHMHIQDKDTALVKQYILHCFFF